MTTMRVSAAERRKLEIERQALADVKRARRAQKAAERKVAKEYKKAAEAAYEKKVADAKACHTVRVQKLYAAHLSSVAQATAMRLKKVAGGLQTFSGFGGEAAPCPDVEPVTSQNVATLEVLLSQVGVCAKATFKAPEFLAPAKPLEFKGGYAYIDVDMASRQSGKTATMAAYAAQARMSPAERLIQRRFEESLAEVTLPPWAMPGGTLKSSGA